MRFLACADFHLRLDVPRCRKQTSDEWIEAQRDQLQFIADKSKEHDNCPVIICGDIFHTPTVPDYFKNMFIDIFRHVPTFAIAGQHDLPYHQWDRLESSSIGVLMIGGRVLSPPGKYAHYGQEIQGSGDMLFLHTLIFPDQKSMPPNTKAMTAEEALNKYPDVKWIISGDQHKPFHYMDNNNRHVLMCGCMNTQSLDQNYLHFIHFVDTEKDRIESIEIPDNCEIVEDTYIQESKEKMDRVKSFAVFVKEKMQQGKGSGIDFGLNVERGTENNPDLTKGAKKIIKELMGG